MKQKTDSDKIYFLIDGKKVTPDLVKSASGKTYAFHKFVPSKVTDDITIQADQYED